MHRKHPIRNSTLLLVTACLATAAFAKSPPDLTPKFDTPAYWDQYAIVHAEVRVHNEGTDITVQLLDQYADLGAPATLTFNPADVWFIPHGDEFTSPPIPAGYDHVILAYPKNSTPTAPGLIVYKPPADESLALFESCRLIQDIRKSNDLPSSFARAVKAADPLAQRYVLNALLAGNPHTLDDALIKRMMDLRADPTAQLKARLLADELLERIGKADDWDWTTTTLRQEPNHPFEEFRTLVGHLLAKTRDGQDRLRTIDFLCTLASDKSGPVSRRMAAISSGGIEDLIDYASPQDPGNTKIFNLAISSLADPSPGICSSAGWALWQCSSRLAAGKAPRDQWLPILQSAIDALRSAGSRQTADDMKIWLEQYRAMIEQITQPAPK